MSWRNTLLLAIVVGAVVAIAYRDVVSDDPGAGWDAVFEEPPPPLPDADIERLVDFDPRAVIGITVERRGETVRARRTAYGWSGIATPRAIEDLLESLTQLAVILTIDDEVGDDDLAGYGMTSPQATLTLEREGEPPIAIRLGHHNPSATGIYAKVSQRGDVVLTGAVAVWDIDKALSTLAAHSGD